jgi:hypothetical protein
MDINKTINEKRELKLNNLYKDYKAAFKIINDKRYKFYNHEEEYKIASSKRRREILSMLPNNSDYAKAYDLKNALYKELSKGEIKNFFTKVGSTPV